MVFGPTNAVPRGNFGILPRGNIPKYQMMVNLTTSLSDFDDAFTFYCLLNFP